MFVKITELVYLLEPLSYEFCALTAVSLQRYISIAVGILLLRQERHSDKKSWQIRLMRCGLETMMQIMEAAMSADATISHLLC